MTEMRRRRSPVAACVVLAASCASAPAHKPAVDDELRGAEAGAKDPEISAEAYRSVLQAELELQEGDLPAGIALLREALLHDPASAYLHVRLAEAWLESGDADQARASAAEALRVDPKSLAAQRVLGEAWAAAGEATKARRAYEDALRLAPGDRGTSLLLAELLVEQGELDNAERVVGKLMDAEPGAVDGYIALGRVFAERGEVERAFAHVEHALERERDDPDALALKLTLLWSLGRFTDALPVAKSFAAAAPDGPEVRRDLLSALALGGATAEADAVARAWLDDDGSERMRLLVADGFERAGELDRAVAALDPKLLGGSVRAGAEVARLQLTRRQPSAAVTAGCAHVEATTDERVAAFAAATCARALLAAGKVRDAEALLGRRVAALGPNARLLDALVAVGKRSTSAATLARSLADTAVAGKQAEVERVIAAARVHEELGDAARAREILDAALREHPRDAELAFALARHLDRQRQPLAGVEIVERLMDRGRRGIDELNFVAFTLADAGVRVDDARRFAWRALVQDPLNGYVVDTLGWAQLMAGDAPGAVETLKRADRLSPGEGEIVFHLASALAQQGDRAAARAAAARAGQLLEEDDPVRPRVTALLAKLGDKTP